MIDFNSLSTELLEFAEHLWQMDYFMFQRADSATFHEWELEGFCFSIKKRADLIALANNPDEIIRIYELWNTMSNKLLPPK